MDLNSTYKLPLIRWLPVIIDSETVHGLEWMDPLKTKFKIPWNDKNKSSNPEEDFKLFKLWALHRKKCNPANPDWTKMKQNFRNALKKSPNFEEISEENVLDRQMDNYRVFLIKYEEVTEDPMTYVDSSQSPPSNVDSEMPVQKKVSDHQLPVNDAQNVAVAVDGPWSAECEVRQWFDRFVYNDPHRYVYQLVVRYFGVTVLEGEVNLGENDGGAGGIRLFYGDDLQQLVDLSLCAELPEHFRLRGVSLPDVDDQDISDEKKKNQIRKVLNDLKQGFVFTVDELGNLMGYRACRSRSYYFPQDAAGAQSKKLNRDTLTPLFSWPEYLSAYVRELFHSGPSPLNGVTIFFYFRPEDLDSSGIITATLKPTIKIKPVDLDSLVGRSISNEIDKLLSGGPNRMEIEAETD